jgi:hypothetical protein
MSWLGEQLQQLADAAAQRKMKGRGDGAFAELKTHLYMLGGWVLAVRAVPYVLHLAQRITSK